MAEIEVGARVRAPVYVSRDILEVRGLAKAGNVAAVEDSSGNLFTVFTKTLTLIPDTLMVELPRATVEIFAGVIWGRVDGLAENEKLAAACRKALERGGVSE